MDEKKRSIYKARAKRIAFYTTIALTMAALLGLVLYLTYLRGQEGQWWLVAIGMAASVVLFGLSGVAIREAERAIQSRGYARPVSTQSVFDKIVSSILPEPGVSHPSQYKKSFKRVKFDDGSFYDVDLGEFYFFLRKEVEYGNILTWRRNVKEQKMDKKKYAAYRQLLEDSAVVDMDSKGSMQLNCEPWPAIEKIKGLQQKF